MNGQDTKCVMVIDENLPFGIIANTAKEFPHMVGTEVFDKTKKQQNPAMGSTAFACVIRSF